jgi:hypothetical protein
MDIFSMNPGPFRFASGIRAGSAVFLLGRTAAITDNGRYKTSVFLAELKISRTADSRDGADDDPV